MGQLLGRLLSQLPVVVIYARLAAACTMLAALDAATVKAEAETFVRRGWPILKEVCDPRGRCNRRAFLVIALVFLAMQTALAALFWISGFEPGFNLTVTLNAPVIWIGTTVCFKRLHDVGLKGWWLPGAFALWFVAAMLVAMIVSMVLGEDAVLPGQPAFYAVFAAITLPAFGALLWLHTAPSDAGDNRFGPIPGETGLSMPRRAAEPVDTESAVAA